MKLSRGSLKSAAFTLAILLAVVLIAGSAAAATFASGDVLVSIGNGKWHWYTPSGTLQGTLDDGAGSGQQEAGGAFNAGGQFYGTDFSLPGVHNFDTSGNLIGSVGSGYDGAPESLLFACQDSIFVGESNVGHIAEFTSAGAVITTFTVGVENKGADWIELLPDQCTMYYTSEGTRILAYNICTNTQLADFVTTASGLLNSGQTDAAYTIRRIHNGANAGTFLVADSKDVKLINSSGSAVLKTFSDPAANSGPPFNVSTWYGLSVDPDGLGFWASEYQSDTLDHFRISDGAILKTIIDTGIHSVGPGPGAVIVAGTVLGSQVCPGTKCALSQGYWKNHASKWPIGSTPMTLGTVSYSKNQLLNILNSHGTGGDASVILAIQLIAANLNIANGSDPTSISATIADANTLLGGGTIPQHVKSSSVLGGKMTADAKLLDNYNNNVNNTTCTP